MTIIETLQIKLVDFTVELVPIWVVLVELLFVISKEVNSERREQYSPERTPTSDFIHNCVINDLILINILFNYTTPY